VKTREPVIVYAALVFAIAYLLGAALTSIFSLAGWHLPWS
jgi:hypothetical protein